MAEAGDDDEEEGTPETPKKSAWETAFGKGKKKA